MKVQCDLCREIVVAELAIDGDRIAVRCPACQGRFTVEAAGKASTPAAPASTSAAAPPAPPPPAPAVAAAWERCKQAWSEAARHDELATTATAHGAYAWVARAYRDRLRDDPSDAIATARLAAIQRITEASLRAAAFVRPGGAGAGAAPTKPYRNTIAILVGLVLLAAAGTIYAMVTSSSEPPEAPPIPVQPHR